MSINIRSKKILTRVDLEWPPW